MYDAREMACPVLNDQGFIDRYAQMLTPVEERELKNLMLHSTCSSEDVSLGSQRRAELLVKASREERVRLYQEVFIRTSNRDLRFSK